MLQFGLVIKISSFPLSWRLSLQHCVVSQCWVIPDLLIGFATDLEHLLALELQLFSQSADIFVECVDLVVQLSDVVLPPGDLLLQLGDPAQQLSLLETQRKQIRVRFHGLMSWPPILLYAPMICNYFLVTKGKSTDTGVYLSNFSQSKVVCVHLHELRGTACLNLVTGS